MSLDQSMPQVSGPLVNPDGTVSQPWWAFFRNMWERTGGAAGASIDDAALLATLNGSGGPTSDPAATGLAQAALLASATPKIQPVDYAQPELFALMLMGGRGNASGSALTAQDEGVSVSTGVMVLNFTGAGVTASLTSPGVVEVVVPSGGGGTVTSITAGAGLSGGTITTTGTIALAAIADQTVLANTSGGSAVPTATAFSGLVGVGSALKWTTGRTITLTGDVTGVSGSFDGSGNLSIALTGVQAAKWTTARTLSFTGDATGSGSVDGSANVATALTLANTAVTPGTYGDATHVAQVTFDAKGRATGAVNVPITGATSLSYVPLSMGTEPLTFVSDGSGQPILVPYTP